MSGNPTTPLPSVRVAWRPEQHTRIANGTFQTNTTGWATTAGINAAGTSITRITTDFHSGSACASVVCSSTDGSGVNFDLGSETFFSEASYGAVYVAVAWLKRVSGSRRAKLILGSEGTSSDRATLTITDLPDAWTPYVIRWLPTANRTDVQLAVTNGSAEALTVRVDDVSVYLLDGFSQVENGSFEVDTTGWVTFSGGAVARSTAEAFGGSACMRITASTTANSGARFLMGGRFLNGRTYRARIAAKAISGVSSTWEFGFLDGTTAYTSTTTFAATSDFAWYTFDATLAADQSDLRILIRHPAASAAVLAVDEVEVYEASDDLGTDAGDTWTWSRKFGEVNTITVPVLSADGLYDPLNTSSDLYGSLEPGRMIWGRATYENALYPLFCGKLSTLEPRPDVAKVDLLAEDMMGMLRDAAVSHDFDQTDTYYYARRASITAAMLGDPALVGVDSYTRSRIDMSESGIEGMPFFNGTDGEVPVLDYLADLNDATQSEHWCAPQVHAMVPWRYTAQSRTDLTDTSSDFTVDETDPPTAFGGVRVTHEALENRVEVTWQGYEKLPPPGADDTGFGAVVFGYDPDVFGPLGMGEEAPYLSFTREEYGSDEDHPDVHWRYPGSRKRWKTRRRRGLKVKRRTRVYPGRVLPFRMTTGDVRRFVFDFAIPVSGPIFNWDATSSTSNFEATYVETRPNRLIIDLRCLATDTITYLIVSGTPWVPLDDLTEVIPNNESIGKRGIRSGDSVDSAYVPGRAMAQGIGRYRTWRWADPRMRPALVDQNHFPRTLTAQPGDRITLTADRYRIPETLFLSTGADWEMSSGGLVWVSTHQLEALPTHSDWFIIGSSLLDGSEVLAP